MKKDKIIKDWNAIKIPQCRMNTIKTIDTKQCRHNCKQWDYKKQKCKLNIS